MPNNKQREGASANRRGAQLRGGQKPISHGSERHQMLASAPRPASKASSIHRASSLRNAGKEKKVLCTLAVRCLTDAPRRLRKPGRGSGRRLAASWRAQCEADVPRQVLGGRDAAARGSRGRSARAAFHSAGLAARSPGTGSGASRGSLSPRRAPDTSTPLYSTIGVMADLKGEEGGADSEVNSLQSG
ncbi:hypothetical protein NDU88_002231 [Pleurodeles waltl]|uniref:Uncharacterized protein n=1 Tax=Pleurodeles waltl TaxID=8319 RepID=A0AAV7SE99_PLEWA|nr:hypothetical protein NDU88_002231 [Pleurodeles waltl]